MIYELEFDLLRFQSVFTTLDFNGSRFSVITRRWSSLEDHEVRFRVAGLGLPVEDFKIRQGMLNLFADFPSEMGLGEYPQEPADFVLGFHPPFVALSAAVASKAPELLEHVASEGVLVDYPYMFPLDHIREWLASDEVQTKWPELRNIEEHPVEILDHGSKYLLRSPSALEGYRIKLYCCTTWQHGLVDRELTNGRWSTWEEDGESTRYYKVDPSANVVVFKRMPPAGTWLFRLSESIARVFCTQDFKDAYDAHSLKGVIFKPMALSESYVPPPPPPPRRWEEERA